MSSVETGQMSAVETGQMTAAGARSVLPQCLNVGIPVIYDHFEDANGTWQMEAMSVAVLPPD